MPTFLDLPAGDGVVYALWGFGADGQARTPQEALMADFWNDKWMPLNDDDFGNPEIGETDG